MTLVCLFIGPITTTLLVAGMAWLCCSEFFRICRMGGRMPNESIGLAAALLYPLAAYAKGQAALVIVTFLLLITCACWYVFTPRANIADVAVTAFGPLYTSLAFSAIVLIRKFDPGVTGAAFTLGVMLSIWANDALAYFVGSQIGVRTELAPRISPHKSWEGFYGGLVASVVVWLAMGALGVEGLTPVPCVLMGLVVGMAGVIGDLFESRIKRGVGVKDSGNLMPGHGGLLDRSDFLALWLHGSLFPASRWRNPLTIFEDTAPRTERPHVVRVAVLGCTGSIGSQTLDVCRRHADRVRVVALSANVSTAALVKAAREFGARHVAPADASRATDPVMSEPSAHLRGRSRRGGRDRARGAFPTLTSW